MKELDIQKSIKNSLVTIGHRCWQVDSGKKVTYKTRGFGLEKGFPDLFGSRKGDNKLFFVEVKKSDGVLSDDQKAFLLAAHKNGILNGVARNVTEAIEIIQGKRTILDEIEVEEIK